MKEKFFSKKSRIICNSWSVVGIILFCAIFIATSLKDSFLQEVIGNIVICYVFVSCILAGIVAYIKKREK